VDDLYLTTRSIRVSQVAKISPPFLVSLQNDVSHIASLLNRKSKPTSFSATDEILNLCRNSELANFFAAEEILKDIPSQYAYAAGQTSIEAFWRTIIGDRWVKVDPTQLLGVLISSPDSEEGEHCFTSFKAVLKGMLIFLENNGFFSQAVNDLTANPIKKPQISALNAPVDMDAVYKFIGSIAVWGKRVALTADGHLCLIPHKSHVGDQIFVVPGLQQPLSLRLTTPMGDKWHLIGACYVHGIMRGEIWNSRDLAGQWQNLVIE